jgi:zinc protease
LFAGAASDDLVRTAAAYIQIAGAKDGDVVGALEALLAEAERIERFAFTEGELERAKVAIKRNYQQAVAENGKTDSNTIAAEYMRHFLEGEPVPGIALELALVERFLDGITLAELNQLGRDWITEDNRVVLVSGPGKQDRPLPSETELAAVFESTGAREVERYVDRVLDEPILPTKPSPGRIVDERRVADLGVTEWRLSNGARVIAKPTDFQNDEILLQAFSPGGTSIVADEDYNSALFATALLGESGLGRFPKLELEKALSGKIANINVDIDELEEGLQAVASKLDLETMFQLVYLAFTAPRADEDAAQGFLVKLSDLIADRLDSPENYFQDKVSEALFQGHPRRRPLTREVLTTIEIERSLAVYRERFADASDFTFVLVGSFTLEELKPFVEGYLAALPALDRRETWRDIGVEAPNRLVDVRVQKGTEPKAAVSLVFTGVAPFSFAAAHELGTLSDVLSMRLRDVLREDRGQTYGVAVDANLRARPRGTYSVTIAFGCAPENAASLIDAVFAEIERLRDGGPTRDELAKIFETQRRERQSALRQNAFWLNVLSNSYRLGRSPQELLRLDAQIAATTTRSLRQAARLYLPLDRYILGVLGPESPAPAPAAVGAAQN